MPERKHVVQVTREWVGKAEEDLKAATYLLRSGREAPAGAVCFHAQQCVEKHIKALLSFKGIPFPKTHDIARLVALLPVGAAVELAAEESRRLTHYATAARYPGGGGPILLPEARKAVAIARRMRRAVRRLLPKECSQPRSK